MKMGSFVLGYHGCDRALGEAVLAGKKDLKPSKNPHGSKKRKRPTNCPWLKHEIPN